MSENNQKIIRSFEIFACLLCRIYILFLGQHNIWATRLESIESNQESNPHLIERDAALPGELLLDLLRGVRVGQVGVEVLVQHLINNIIKLINILIK